MPNRSRKNFRFLGQRMIVFYFIGVLCVVSLFDYQGTMDQVKLSVLNRLMPTCINFAKFIEHRGPLDKSDLKDYIVCFREVVRDFPAFFEAWGILGFTYYHLGKTEQALYSYERALEGNPNNFWFYHDMGMIYFKIGQPEKAKDSFKKALMVNSDITLASLLSSRVYIPIFQLIMADRRAVLGENLQKGYQHCFQMMVLLEYRSGNFAEALRGTQYAIKTNTEPQDFFYHFAGLAAYQLKDYKMALYFLQESLKLNPRNAEIFHSLGLVWQALGKNDLAAKFFQEEESLKKSSPEAASIEASMQPWLM